MNVYDGKGRIGIVGYLRIWEGIKYCSYVKEFVFMKWVMFFIVVGGKVRLIVINVGKFVGLIIGWGDYYLIVFIFFVKIGGSI